MAENVVGEIGLPREFSYFVEKNKYEQVKCTSDALKIRMSCRTLTATLYEVGCCDFQGHIAFNRYKNYILRTPSNAQRTQPTAATRNYRSLDLFCENPFPVAIKVQKEEEKRNVNLSVSSDFCIYVIRT